MRHTPLSFPHLFYSPCRELDIDSGGGRRRLRTSGLLSDGAPGLRELRAHGEPRVRDAGGWTLLPGENTRQSFFCSLSVCYNVLFLCSPVPGTAPGKSSCHNRKCPDLMMSLCVNGGVSSPKRSRIKMNIVRGSYKVAVLPH